MKILRSFTFAGKGIVKGLEEHNMRFHLVCAVIVLLLGFFFSITLVEWIALILSIGLVLSTELINTAIEEVCDMVTAAHPQSYTKAGKPKDISAGAVLVASIVALAVGLKIFIPYISTYINGL